MATSSIRKEFYINNENEYDNLKEELSKSPERKTVTSSPSMDKGRKKLATFVFR